MREPSPQTPGRRPAPPADDQKTRTELPAFSEDLVPAPPGSRDDQRTITEMRALDDTSKLRGLVVSPAPAQPPRKKAQSRPSAPEAPAAAAAPSAAPIPATKRYEKKKFEVPGYDIESLLGEGAMGAVYRATQRTSGRVVAIKTLPPHLAMNQEYIARFYREAESAMKLHHPNIVAGLAVGETLGSHFFIMEFVDGESLEKKIKRDKKVDEDLVVEWGIEIASALECAAKEQIVHRDLKPANILVTKDGQVKLVDLGLAKQVAGAGSEKQNLTRMGVIMGSPYYLAPEQAAMGQIDQRTDLYGVGATLYHVATGTTPFDGEDPIEILEQVIGAPPPDPRARNGKLTVGFSQIIRKLMAKKKTERHQTATELREAFEQLKRRKSGFMGWLRRVFGKL